MSETSGDVQLRLRQGDVAPDTAGAQFSSFDLPQFNNKGKFALRGSLRLGTGDATSDNTWVQWYLPWDAASGEHTIRVRATNTEGQVQTEEEPTGFHLVRRDGSVLDPALSLSAQRVLDGELIALRAFAESLPSFSPRVARMGSTTSRVVPG